MSLSSVEPVEPGRIVAGRYAILRPLGSGGGGDVWLAEDLKRDRRLVAFKCVIPQEIGAGWTLMAEGLKQEFRVLTRLRHPHLMRVFDIGALSHGGRYLTTEFVDGEPLEQLIGNFPPEHVELLLAQLLQALDYLDRRGVLHRDLKPANIMVRWRLTGAHGAVVPQVKVVDFGLALSLSQRDGPGLEGGTRPYMAPETLLGRPADVVSELYSLGATIFHLVTGAPPREGALNSPVGLLMLEPVGLEDFPADVSPAARGILRRMLSISRHGRYTNAREALEELAYRSGGRLDPAALTTRLGTLDDGALVGRRELLAPVLEALTGGHAGRWVLLGQPGLGKRRMAREIEIQAQLQERPSFRVEVHPGCTPFSIPLQLLDQLAHWRGERKPEPEADSTMVARTRRRSLFSGASRAFEAELLSRLGELGELQGATVIIEDLDLADAWSLRLLRRWFERSGAMVLVATAREVPEVLREHMDPLVARPLSASEVGAFLEDMLGEVDLPVEALERLCQLSGGLPSNLRALCARLLDEGLLRQVRGGSWSLVNLPDGERFDVDEALRLGVGDLGHEAEAIVEVLALIQRAIPVALMSQMLARLTGQTQIGALHMMRLLDELERRYFLHLDRHLDMLHVRPAGERIQKLVRAQMVPSRECEVHLAIGEVLAEAWMAQAGAEPREVAYHLQRVDTRTQAACFEQIAAIEALKVGALGRAAEHLRYALQGRPLTMERAYIRLFQGTLALRGAEIDTARAAMVEAAQLAQMGYTGVLAHVFQARLALQLGLLDEATALMDEIVRRWPSMSGNFQCLRLEGDRARASLRYPEAMGFYEQAEARARMGGWFEGVRAARLEQAACALEMGDLDEAIVRHRELLKAAGQDDPRVEGQLRTLWGWLRFLEGDFEEAYVHVRAGLRLLRVIGEVPRQIEALVMLASIEFERGNPAQTGRWAREAMALRRPGVDKGEQLLLSGLHHISRLGEGLEPEQALETLEALAVRASAKAHPLKAARAQLLLSRAYLHLGRKEDARATLRSAQEAMARTPTGDNMLGVYARLMEKMLGQR